MISELDRAEVARSAGLVIDTSLVVLLIVAEISLDLVTRFKRTRSLFDESDAALLSELVEPARALVTTPHVLAESSNHLGQLKSEKDRVAARILLFRSLRLWEERWIAFEGVDCRDVGLYRRLGLTDWGLARLSDDGYVVLTTDSRLCDEIWKRGRPAMNFNHHRG